MQNATLTAVHRAEVEWLVRFPNTIRGSFRAHPQLLNTQHAMIVRIKAQSRVLIGRHAERFHRQMFKREQDLSLVTQEDLDVLPFESNNEIGILKVGMQSLSARDVVGQIKVGIVENHV